MPNDRASNPPMPHIPVIDVENEARNAEVVDAGFWEKVKRLAGRLPFADTLVAAWFCARDPETPPRVRAMLLGALAYFVVPTDVIPDFLLHLGGFTDDAAVLAAVVGIVGAHLRPHHRAEARKALGLPPLPEEEPAPVTAEPPKRKKRFGLF